MLRFAILAWSILMLGLATPADAALLRFTVFGFDTGSGLTPAPVEFALFEIESSPTVEPINVNPGTGFGLRDVAGIFQYGDTIRTDPQAINFFHADIGGGFAIGEDFFLLYDSPQLYTGPEATPTFTAGSFTLTDTRSRSQISLTVQQVAAVPEPASWAMMLTGFGLVGGMMRYRRRTTTMSAA